MKRNPKKVGLAILYVVLAAAATVVCFLLETNSDSRMSRKMRLTAGCLMATLACLWYLYMVLSGKDKDPDFTYVIEDMFAMNKGGCVVLGKVQGAISVGRKLCILTRTGERILSKVSAMEINRHSVKAAKDTYVALYLKDVSKEALAKGDTIVPAEKMQKAE